MNRHLKYTHGGGDERGEGLGSYNVPWGQPLAQVANAWQQPGAPILKTGHAGVYMSNRYDAVTPREAQYIPGFSPYSTNSPAPHPSITAAHLKKGGGPAGFTNKGTAISPGTIATQSSASYNHLAQRFMPDGRTDFSREMEGDPKQAAAYPREPYVYQDSPLLRSNAEMQEIRSLAGGPSLAEIQQGWNGLEQARRQLAESNFRRANDTASAANAAVVVEASSSSGKPAAGESGGGGMTTIVISTATLEVVAIVGAVVVILLLALAVKGAIDLIF
jgi:hypothetical protein